MKKILLLMCLLFNFITIVSAQYEGISSDIKVNVDEKGVPDGTYKVSFVNSKNEQKSFVCYLSYSGKRVSDYYNCVVSGGGAQYRGGSMSWYPGESSKNMFAWPNTVPKGHEKYVTAQLGKEPVKKDRRDDD